MEDDRGVAFSNARYKQSKLTALEEMEFVKAELNTCEQNITRIFKTGVNKAKVSYLMLLSLVIDTFR